MTRKNIRKTSFISIRRASMARQDKQALLQSREDSGITLMDVIAAAALIAIVTAFAVPYTAQRFRNAEYRSSASNIVSLLREAKSRAIASSLEHRVEFENINRRYRMTRGNRASNSGEWNTVVHEWTVLPGGVLLNANVESIQLLANGTATGGTISIQDESRKTRCEVRVSRTGRARIPVLF
jgi:Tfp pilus assembly protein FimT